MTCLEDPRSAPGAANWGPRRHALRVRGSPPAQGGFPLRFDHSPPVPPGRSSAWPSTGRGRRRHLSEVECNPRQDRVTNRAGGVHQDPMGSRQAKAQPLGVAKLLQPKQRVLSACHGRWQSAHTQAEVRPRKHSRRAARRADCLAFRS